MFSKICHFKSYANIQYKVILPTPINHPLDFLTVCSFICILDATYQYVIKHEWQWKTVCPGNNPVSSFPLHNTTTNIVVVRYCRQVSYLFQIAYILRCIELYFKHLHQHNWYTFTRYSFLQENLDTDHIVLIFFSHTHACTPARTHTHS